MDPFLLGLGAVLAVDGVRAPTDPPALGEHPELFASPPDIEQVDVIASR